MSYHRHGGYGGGYGGNYEWIGSLIGLIIVLAIIAAYILFRCCVVIVRTLRRHGSEVKWLWYSVAGFVLLSIIGIVLGVVFQHPEYGELGLIGFAQLFGCCKYVEAKYNQYFLSEEGSLTQKVLKTSWWADYNE